MAKIKIGVIPSAGLGSRMFPYTKVSNKVMLPIINKPAIDYQIKELTNAGITEIYITGRYLKGVKDYFKHDIKLEHLTENFGHRDTIQKLRLANKPCTLHFISQPEPKGWMYEIYQLQSKLKGEAFIVALSDIIIEGNPLQELIDKFHETNLHIYSSGRYIFGPTIFEVLNKQKYFLGDDTHVVTNVTKELSATANLLHMALKGKRCDIGSPIEYLKTITYFCLKDAETKNEYLEHLRNLCQSPVIKENPPKA